MAAGLLVALICGLLLSWLTGGRIVARATRLRSIDRSSP
jgi:hypothetical protein